MVTFECGGCIKVLKKNQIEKHIYECKNSHSFICIDCYVHFDRESVKGHISCITEVEKYAKNDNTAKKPIFNKPAAKEVIAVDLNKLEWKGFRKTAKKILMSHENYKLTNQELFKKLAQVYAKNKNCDVDEVDQDLLKKHTLSKLENDDKFVLDLSKNTIRYKA